MYVPPVSFGSRARKRKICLAAAVDARHRAVARDGPDRVRREQVAQREALLARERVEDPPDDALVSGVGTARLPLVDQALDVPALRLGEVEQLEQPPRLGRVVVRDRRLEVLALRRRLAQLAAEPAQEAHGGLIGHRALTLLGWTRSSRSRAAATSGATGRAARRGRRRAHPRRGPPGGLGVEPAAVDVRRRRGPRAVEALARDRLRPDNVLGAGLVVAVVVSGQGAGLLRRGARGAEHAARRLERGHRVVPERDRRPGRGARGARARATRRRP